MLTINIFLLRVSDTAGRICMCVVYKMMLLKV